MVWPCSNTPDHTFFTTPSVAALLALYATASKIPITNRPRYGLTYPSSRRYNGQISNFVLIPRRDYTTRPCADGMGIWHRKIKRTHDVT
jgi:hypothetical protein